MNLIIHALFAIAFQGKAHRMNEIPAKDHRHLYLGVPLCPFDLGGMRLHVEVFRLAVHLVEASPEILVLDILADRSVDPVERWMRAPQVMELVGLGREKNRLLHDLDPGAHLRSEERRVGKEGVSPCRSWW